VLAARGPTAGPPPPPVGDWATAAFGGAALGDRRLAPRLLVLARDFFARPQAQLPPACQSRAKTKAASRFFEHPATPRQTLWQPHDEQTRQRVQRERVVLAVQDTTSLH
jgi:hypothetical protein